VSGETMAVRVRRGAGVTVPLLEQLGKARRSPPRPDRRDHDPFRGDRCG